MAGILAAVLALSITAFAMGEAQTVYQSDFTKGEDGWYARSVGGATVKVLKEENALRIQGRTADWNSPGRDFDLVAGVAYEMSVQVRQNDMDNVEFIVSIAHSTEDGETYENLGRVRVKKGEWTEITGKYNAGDYIRSVLYVETLGAPQLGYDIRDFRLFAPEGAQAAPAEPELNLNLSQGEELPSLKEIYAGKFDMGTAIPRMLISNHKTMELAKKQFNIVTPENEMKPDAILDVAASRKLAAEDETAAAVHFDSAKPLLDFAKKNGIKVHGHVLVWHSQTPEAFFHEGYDVKKPLVTRDVMLARLENYIRGVMAYLDENYPSVVVSWDVVNEAIDDGTNRLRESNWKKVVGEDFVNRAFELARKYAPEGTLLYYNDYNSAMKGKLEGIYKLVTGVMEEGNIDGYGFQMHHDISYPSMSMITAAVERMAALGIRLRVSELDIGIPSNAESNLNKQAKMYADIMKLLLRFSDQVEAVQVWGMTDVNTWRTGKYPLLFDGKLNPKPAFWAVAYPDSI